MLSKHFSTSESTLTIESPVSDAAVVRQMQHSNSNAGFDILYRRYYRRVFDFCRRYANDSDVAYDLTQAAFFKAIEKIHTLKSPQTFLSWLFRIARNECINQLSPAARRKKISIDAMTDTPDDTPSGEIHIEREKREELLMDCLQNLSVDCRNILVMKYIDDRSVKEIAGNFQMGESAVKMRLLRARNQVVEMMAATA